MKKKKVELELEPPDDLDEVSLRKWHELASEVRRSQRHLLANLARNHGNLIAVRKAKAAAVKDGTFQAMTVAKNGSTVLNPYIRAETRLLALENRMLASMGVGDGDYW